MKKIIIALILAVFTISVVACNSSGGDSAAGGKIVTEHTAGNIKITLSTDDGIIKDGQDEFTIAFTDASGNPAKIDAASVNFNMPAMVSMAEMNDSATLTSTSTPGVFKGSVKLQMAGSWQVQVAYEGASGNGKTSFPIMAQ